MLRHALRLGGRLAALITLAGYVAACMDHGPDRKPARITIPVPSHAELASGTEITLVASVTNAGGDVLTGNTILWTSSDATIASVTPAGVVTGIHVGEAQITATVGTLHSLPISVTVTPGVAAKLTIRTQPNGAASGVPLTTQPVLEIDDAADNLVTSATETVTAIIASGGGTVTGSTATAVGGVATFNGLTLSGTIGDRTLLFAVSGLTAARAVLPSLPGPRRGSSSERNRRVLRPAPRSPLNR